MSKEFRQMGQGAAANPAMLAAPGKVIPQMFSGDTPPIISGHADAPTDSTGDGSWAPSMGQHETDDPITKRKKIDWKGMIQNSLSGAMDNSDEDPLAILQMQQGNQASYMNPRTY
jgi:hypothetical protein